MESIQSIVPTLNFYFFKFEVLRGKFDKVKTFDTKELWHFLEKLNLQKSSKVMSSLLEEKSSSPSRNPKSSNHTVVTYHISCRLNFTCIQADWLSTCSANETRKKNNNSKTIHSQACESLAMIYDGILRSTSKEPTE